MAKRNVLEYVSRPIRVVITLSLTMFIVLFAQFLITQVVWLYAYEKSPPKFPDDQQWRTHRADKLFLPDGTMHLVRRVDTQDNGDYTKEEITDVNGNVLWQGIREERPFKYLDWVSQPTWPAWFFDLHTLDPALTGVLEVPVRVAGAVEVNEVWQYDFEGDVFAGYKVEGGLIGYLGADGFVISRAQAQPLGEFNGFTSWTDEEPSSIVMLWQTKQRIYQIDFRNRTVETVFDSAKSDIESIRWHKWRPTNPKDREDSDIQYRPLIDCRTADRRHHLIMREPNQVLTVELPEQMRPKQTFRYWPSNVGFTATSDALFLKYHEGRFNPSESYKLMEQYRREYDSKPQPQLLQLYKVAGDGKLEPVNQFDWIRPACQTYYPPDPRETIMRWVSNTSPPVFGLLWELFGDSLYKFSREGMGMMQGYAIIITEFRPRHSSLNYVLSAVMVAFALWHGWPRRTSRSKLIFWLIIVGAFNIAGLLTYLGLNHTPVIKCPACGKKRGLEKFNCIRCSSAFVVPQRKPTDLILAN